MNYFLIAGEASGDQHAGELIQALRALDADASFSGLGGDRMQAAGCRLYQHYRKMAYMGIVEVVKNLSKIRRNFRIAQDALLAEKPDVLILIDYPSFNLKMAAFCRKHLPAAKIYYYIPPKVWAWKSWRVHQIARLSDEVLGIFPFEPAFYARYGYHCHYVGNPTAEEIQRFHDSTVSPQGERFNDSTVKPYIALLPGSRKGEIRNCLPKMIEAARRMGDAYEIIIAGAPGISPDFYAEYADDCRVVFGETYQLVSGAQAAIVNSGTATLEVALLRCPQVAVYHLACPRLVALLRPPFERLVFSTPFYTLPNIIAGREVVSEKIANLFTVDAVADELRLLLHDADHRQAQLRAYDELSTLLGNQHAASSAALIITQR